ncbi:hypothetical protein GCM10009425_45940 [Pseudomonas asuensis]|uniref:Uncharacterized protein n=1 Tax=Pseudomonas asuensis TaxID=1825787 RepID=A0ABQ2H413_9PSED|nr:hypothetical protein GCM10009425_45940 [Pseudomonas asuensis]
MRRAIIGLMEAYRPSIWPTPQIKLKAAMWMMTSCFVFMGEVLKVADTFTLSRDFGYARARSAAERALEHMGQVEAPVTISKIYRFPSQYEPS